MKEDVLQFNRAYVPNQGLRPSQQQQIYDDIRKLQKEFASEIYITRTREKYF